MTSSYNHNASNTDRKTQPGQIIFLYLQLKVSSFWLYNLLIRL
jgi:hypothetical protein